MLNPPRYDFIDVLWAPARALSAKKIFVMTLFLGLGLIWFDLLTYLAIAIGKEKVSAVYAIYGLLPFADFELGSRLAGFIHLLAPVGALLWVMMGFFAVAAFEIEEVRGHRFMGIATVLRFTVSRFTQILLSELALILFLLLIVGLFALLGLVSRIPFLGEWVFVLSFALPGFIVAILAVFIFAVLQISVILLPAVAAAERNGEVFTAILETFSTVIRQPLRWLGYTLYGLVAAKLCSFVYAYFAYRAVQLSTWAASLGGGRDLENLVRGGLSHLPVRSDLVRETFTLFPGLDWSFSVAGWARPGSAEVVSHAMALMLFLVFLSVIGYLLAVVASSQARAYVALRYIKDSYKIGDEEAMFFEEEHVNPPIAQDSQQPGPLPD